MGPRGRVAIVIPGTKKEESNRERKAGAEEKLLPARRVPEQDLTQTKA